MGRIHFGLRLWSENRADEAMRLAQYALKKYDFHQVWFADNIGWTNPFVVLTAWALELPVHIGTQVLVPFFRSPFEAASALSSISDLMDGRRLDVGIGSGTQVHLRTIEMPDQTQLTREAVIALKKLLKGKVAYHDHYPRLTRYFSLKKGARTKLEHPPSSEIPLLVSASGRKMIRIAATYGDGWLIPGGAPVGSFTGIERGLLKKAAEDVRALWRKRGIEEKGRMIMSTRFYVDDDRSEARRNANRSLAWFIVNTPDDDLRTLGFTPENINGVSKSAITAAFQHGLTPEQVAASLPLGLADLGLTNTIVGSPKECSDRLGVLVNEAREHEVEQITVAVHFTKQTRRDIDQIAQVLTTS